MTYKNLSKTFLINLILIITIFALDRISKIYVISMSNNVLISDIFVSKFLNISLIWNEGIAFGLFSFDQNYLYNLLTIIISIIIFIIFVMLIQQKGLRKYALSMIFGGAIGNLYDRIFFQAVPDFIDFHFADFHWFIFNIADIFITVGVIFMIFCELIGINDQYEKN